jgi:predicted adenylyl cyclase CyaB
MPQNLEVKARIASVEDTIDLAERLGARHIGSLVQKDTYFRVAHGRLKLREIRNQSNELIHYERGEDQNHRLSQFEIFPVEDPRTLSLMLHQALGVETVVLKSRELYLDGSTRIHIDCVECLGAFLEFEVPIARSLEAAEGTMRRLCDWFAIQESAYVHASYRELMLSLRQQPKNL